MRGSKKVCQRGPTLTTTFLLVDVGREDLNSTISGPSSVHCPTLNAALVAL